MATDLKDRELNGADEDEENLDGAHDDLGFHPEHREALNKQLEDEFNVPTTEEPTYGGPVGGSSSAGSPGVRDTRPDLRSDAGLRRSGAPDLAKQKRDQDRRDAKHEAAAPNTDLRAHELGSSHNPNADNVGDQIGQGFSPTDTSKLGFAFAAGKLFANLTGNKKALAGGGGAVGIIILIIVGFFALGTLKIEHIVDNIENHFEAGSMNAIDNETQNAFQSYIKKYVLPAYRHCGTTISKECSVKVLGPTTNPVTHLYKAWAQARVENHLATGDKFIIQYNRISRTWRVITPDTGKDGLNIGPNGENLGQVMDKRADVRAAANKAIEGETGLKKMVIRYQIGTLLQEKYGIKRCIIFCGTKDALADSVDAQKKAAQMFFVEKVLIPRTQTLGLALKCFMDDNCNPVKTKPEPCAEGTDCAMNGAPESDTDRAARQALEDYAAENGITDVAKFTADVNGIAEKGINKYISETMLKLVFDDAVAGTIADKIPFIGWANLAAKIVNGANDAGPKLKKLSYIVDITAAVRLYMMYRTYADEAHTGHLTATELGSFTDSLGPGDHTDGSHDTQLGGTADATQSREYASVIGGVNNPTPSKSYLCNNGKPESSTENTCPEEAAGVGNNIANTIHDFLNLPGVNIITTVAKIWRSTLGQVFRLANGILGFLINPAIKALDLNCDIPGLPPELQPGNLAPIQNYCVLRAQWKVLSAKAAPLIIKGISRFLIADPFGNYESGGRKTSLLLMGGDGAYNDFAHNSLGGQVLSPKEITGIRNDQQTQEQLQFSQQPLFARLFDTNSAYSLISKVAMDVPVGVSSYGYSFANFISNPLTMLSHSFASLVPSKVGAATGAQPDPFGIPQYGYKSVPPDPQTYWSQHCADNPSVDQGAMTVAYNNAAANGPVDSNTGMPVNTSPDPCLLVNDIAGAAGGKYDTSLLSKDDVAQTGVGTSGL